MSLRGRLLLALLAMAAVGMLVFGVAAHTALRAYLEDRVDLQVSSATFPVVAALAEDALESGALKRPPDARDFPIEDVPGTVGDSNAVQLPPGTYGELRNRRGKVVADTSISYGEEDLPVPEIPDGLVPGGDPVNVTSADGSTEFRVAALSLPRSRATVVVAVPLTELQETLDRLRLIEIVAGAVVLLALALLGRWVIGVGLRPLGHMEESAGRIASGELSRRVEPADERTEVGRLGVALNEMLRQIEVAFREREASEERLRGFLADASHELRTPLSSIRGYSELVRMGAAADPGELERALARIESESVRMGGIVEDLLALARLDRVSQSMREPVDLVALADEARTDALAASPKREIEVVVDGAREAVVLGDRSQLGQVLANLLSNAVRHTPDRTPIEVRIASADGEITVAVRDHGPGLAPGTEEKVFERFWRPSASRNRDDGGSGLGLAIVRAIADAHGGRVTARNAPGGGAEFTMFLPGADSDLPARSEEEPTAV